MIFDEAVSFGPESDNLTSLVVVEFKRPDREDFGTESPIAQAHRMIREIRQGKAKRLKGRKISVISADIPAYAYIVCDLSEALVILAEEAGLVKTADQLGYANYFPGTHTYIEIIPYNKLVGRREEAEQAPV
jgi:hypothetical protein